MSKQSKNKQSQQYAGSVSNLMTFTEYAEKKDICIKTVYNHIKNGNLRPVIIGKSKFIAIK